MAPVRTHSPDSPEFGLSTAPIPGARPALAMQTILERSSCTAITAPVALVSGIICLAINCKATRGWERSTSTFSRSVTIDMAGDRERDTTFSTVECS